MFGVFEGKHLFGAWLGGGSKYRTLLVDRAFPNPKVDSLFPNPEVTSCRARLACACG